MLLGAIEGNFYLVTRVVIYFEIPKETKIWITTVLGDLGGNFIFGALICDLFYECP